MHTYIIVATFDIHRIKFVLFFPLCCRGDQIQVLEHDRIVLSLTCTCIPRKHPSVTLGCVYLITLSNNIMRGFYLSTVL